jgi:hypothetical protein
LLSAINLGPELAEKFVGFNESLKIQKKTDISEPAQ